MKSAFRPISKRRKRVHVLFIVVLSSFLLFPAASVQGAESREVLIDTARRLSWENRYDEAKAIYRGLIAQNRRDIEAKLGLAAVLSWEKKYDESINQYDEILQIKPGDVEALMGKLKIASWQGRYRESLEGLETLRKEHPDNIELLTLIGRVASWDGQYERSVSAYEEALTHEPANLETLRGLANTLKWMGKIQRAMAINRRILEKRPKDFQATLDMGILSSQAGDQKQAISFLEKARDLEPQRQDVRAMLGTLYARTAQLDSAVTELQKALALEGGDISSYIALGRVYSWQKNIDESIKLYEMALKTDPENIEALVGLGNTYFYDNQWDRAEAMYRRALVSRPGEATASKALRRLKKIKAPESTVRSRYFEFRDHDPEADRLASRFLEQRKTASFLYKVNPATVLELRYQRVDQKQLDEVDDSTDFEIDANVGSLGFRRNLPKAFAIRGRYDFSEFSNNGNNSFNLTGSKIDHAGFLILSREYERHYSTASFARELFIDTSTGDAEVASINTYGVSYDFDFTEHFSTLAAAALDDFSTRTSLRQDYRLRPRLRLPFFPSVRLENEFRYLSEPVEFVNSFFVDFTSRIKEIMQLRLDYIFSYSTLDDAFAHQGELFFTLDIGDRISWSTEAIFAIEHSGDRDITQQYQTYLTVRF